MLAPDTQVPLTFEEFVGARQQALLRSARLLVANAQDAEDLVQEALARCVPVWSRIEGDPEPYVRTVMVRQNISRWRRRRVVEVAEPVGDAWHPRAGDHATVVGEQDELVAALARLAPPANGPRSCCGTSNSCPRRRWPGGWGARWAR